jgi:hypothetical protein
MKYLFNRLFLLLLICGCSSSPKQQKFAGFAGLCKGDKTIVISCIRCSCVIEVLNHTIETNPGLLNGYSFVGDTTCNGGFLWRSKMFHYSQKQLDSISTELYNMLIIKTNGGGKTLRLIETLEAPEPEKYL